jgi:hypothetical protein
MAFHTPTESKFTHDYLEEVDLAFSAIDCVLRRERAIYASTELTTGLRLYEALREKGVRTAAELRANMGHPWFTANVWDPNVANALEFAEAIRQEQNERTLVISPAPFSAPGWTQPEYLAFWETLLQTRIKGAWFNRNWQFSNGCTFEYAVAQDALVPTFDNQGRPLNLDTAVRLITEAMASLEVDRFDTAGLRENLDRVIARKLRDHPALEP